MTTEEKINYENNYRELFQENINLTVFYSRLMNFLHKETKVLNISTEMKYKIVENEKYTDLENSLT